MKPSAALATLRQLASMRLPSKMSQGTLSLLMREVIPSETFSIPLDK